MKAKIIQAYLRGGYHSDTLRKQLTVSKTTLYWIAKCLIKKTHP